MFYAQVKTDCKDCGHNIYHSPVYSNAVANMAEKFDDDRVTIFYHFTSRHYLTIIKGLKQKVFMSCAQSIEQLQRDNEVVKVLAWARGEDIE